MNRVNKIILCGLLLCLFGAGKGYGQEVDIKIDKRYGGLVAAWNFDGSLEELISGTELKANKGKPAYTLDRNLDEGKALLVQKGQFLSGLNDLLPQGDSPRTVMFWMRKTGCGNADITLLHFGDNSKPRGSMNIRLRPCAEWGDYMTTSFVPDLEGNHKYSDALEGDFYGGLWSHIAITYSSGIVRAYYNGSAVRNYPPSSSSQRADTASAEVALGWVMSSDENDDTVICLDEVRVFSQRLSAAQIKKIYDHERPTFDPPTISIEKSGDKRMVTITASTVPGENYVWETSRNLIKWRSYGARFQALKKEEQKKFLHNSKFAFYRLRYIR